MSRLAGAVLLAGVTLAVASFPAWAQGRLAIEWDRDRLTVDAEAMPLASVLDAVAGRTGVAIEGAEALRKEVSVRFAGLGLHEAIRRLAGGVDHVIVDETSPSGQSRPVLAVFFAGTGPRDSGAHVAVGGSPSAETPIVQSETERLEVESAGQRIAAETLLDQAGDEALPPGRSRADLLLDLERGLAKVAELDRQQAAAQTTGTPAGAQ